MPRDPPAPCLLHLPQLTPGRGSRVWKRVWPRGCGGSCSRCRRRRLPAAALSVHLGAVPAATAVPSPGEGGRSPDWVCATRRPRARLPAAAAPSAPRTAASPVAPRAAKPRGAVRRLCPPASQTVRGRGAAHRVLIPPTSSPPARGGSLLRAPLQERRAPREATRQCPEDRTRLLRPGQSRD